MRGEESGDQGGRGTMLRVEQRGELDGTGVRRRKQSREGRVKKKVGVDRARGFVIDWEVRVLMLSAFWNRGSLTD